MPKNFMYTKKNISKPWFQWVTHGCSISLQHSLFNKMNDSFMVRVLSLQNSPYIIQFLEESIFSDQRYFWKVIRYQNWPL